MNRSGWLSVLLFILGAAALGALVFPLTARPITWDEMLYMGVAYHPTPEPHILNRYFHIYLLRGFMQLFADPYLATRVWWSVIFSLSVSMLVALGLRLAGLTRVFVLTLFSYLLLTQDTFTWSLGIAYADYTLMLLVTASVAIIFPAVSERREVGHVSAFLLGVLFLLAMKSKEPAFALVALPATFFVSPGSDLRIGLRAWSRLAVYLLGAAVGLGVMMGLDHLVLGDAYFGIRPENWKVLRDFNTIVLPEEPVSWLSWMLRPENFFSFVLYVVAAGVCAAYEKDLRLSLVLLMPLLVVLLLVSVFMTGNSVVSARYAVPFLPIMCFLGAWSTERVFVRLADDPRWAAVARVGAVVIICVCLVLILMPSPLSDPFVIDRRVLKDVVQPWTILACAAGLVLLLGGLRQLRVPALVLIFALFCATGLNPGVRVTRSLYGRDLALWAERRYRDFDTLLPKIVFTPTDRFLISATAQDGELYNRGPMFARNFLSFGLRQPMAVDRVVFTNDLAAESPENLRQFTYVLAPPTELEAVMGRMQPAPDGAAPAPLHGPDGKLSLLRIGSANWLPSSQPAK